MQVPSGRVVVLAALVFAIGCATTRPTCPTYTPSPGAGPFVWRVSGPHGSMVIQATHQGASPGDVSSAAWAALDAAELYVVEAEEASAHASGGDDERNLLFHLPRERSLRRLLGDSDFEALQDLTGIAPYELARLKPWVAFMALGRSQVRFAEPSLNAGLLDRARARAIAELHLETWEQQVSYLDAAITPAKLSRAIRDAPNMACDLSRRLAAFRAGDDAVFVNDVGADEPVMSRITRWYVRLRGIVDGGKLGFAAIGIGQLLGPHGVLARFAAEGYAVERL